MAATVRPRRAGRKNPRDDEAGGPSPSGRLGYPWPACAGSAGTCRARGRPRQKPSGPWPGRSRTAGLTAKGFHLDGPVALGHRRLSIIDLSEAASEPMTNEDGSLWLTFNGEIYNFRELRRGLEARHRFRSRSDGEVILHLYEEKGDAAVAELDGMFAFALWDARRRRLLLARDRVGKKPLFYHDGPRVFAFASEAKALLAHPGVPHERDPEALPLFLTYGYVPTPGTFYRGIRALPPGHRLVVTEAGAEAPKRYWRARFRSGGRTETAGPVPDRRRGRGALPRAAAGGRRAAAGGRRAARRLPLRRPRLLDGRRAHGRGGGRPREDVHDRLRGPQRTTTSARTRAWWRSASRPSTRSSWSSRRRSTSWTGSCGTTTGPSATPRRCRRTCCRS